MIARGTIARLQEYLWPQLVESRGCGVFRGTTRTAASTFDSFKTAQRLRPSSITFISKTCCALGGHGVRVGGRSRVGSDGRWRACGRSVGYGFPSSLVRRLFHGRKRADRAVSLASTRGGPRVPVRSAPPRSANCSRSWSQVAGSKSCSPSLRSRRRDQERRAMLGQPTDSWHEASSEVCDSALYRGVPLAHLSDSPIRSLGGSRKCSARVKALPEALSSKEET